MFDEADAGFIPAYSAVGAPGHQPRLVVSISKMDNGYTVQLREIPKPKRRVPIAPIESPFIGMEPDEIVDKMIDGVGAIVRSFHAEAEDWKGSEEREKVREAFKVMFPDFSRQAIRLTAQPDPVDPDELREPRAESLVFESKESLMAYLDKNLSST